METRVITKTVQICTCKRCGNEWEPRLDGQLPKQCPKCHSPLWNNDYQRQPKEKEAVDPTA